MIIPARGCWICSLYMLLLMQVLWWSVAIGVDQSHLTCSSWYLRLVPYKLAELMYALGHLILVRTGRLDLSPHIGLFSRKSFCQNLSRFARWLTTLYSMVNILLRDVILVNLGFDMCSHCLSILIPFFRLKKWQICFGWIDLTPYTEFIVTHDYPTESVYF